MPYDFVSAKTAALLAAKLSEAEACVAPKDSSLCRENAQNYLQSSTPSVSATGSSMAGRRTVAILDAGSLQSTDISTPASMRLPVISVLYSPAQAKPGELHSAFYSLADSGCVMFSAENLQELMDLTMIACRVSEDRKVLLPSVVQFDDPSLMEDASIPGDKVISAFLNNPALPHRIDAKKPAALGGPSWEPALKMQHSKAMENAASLFKSSSETWNAKFRRSYGTIDNYKTEDADLILVMMGSHSATAKKAVDRARERGLRAGVARITMFRPFPYKELSETLSSAKFSATVDFSAPLGGKTPLQREAGTAANFAVMKRPSEKDFEGMFAKLSREAKTHWVI
ncbi:MAG: hypothetical protein J4431_02570 [Candidatus Aenigmarchaeota archaeon]|nr:hypothetical protein [Candidatus Aenigmarchaeota archaeon]